MPGSTIRKAARCYGVLAKRDRITHRFPLAAADEIDGEVEEWLKIAYESDS